jgi:PKD repeat protein
MQEWIYFIDAIDGTIHKSYNNTKYDGPATATAYDLNGVLRTFNTYLENGLYTLVNAAETMYNPSTQDGAIVTLDAQNTSSQSSTFNYKEITSPNNTWNNEKAVSAHYNTTLTYRYLKNTFNRNSINDNGGSIYSFINVANENGSSMGNAFWNGRFVSYGNGDSDLKPLAGALDVTAHEIGHGIVSNTANLEYLDQSGAINETFADIFGAMVDREDWYIGEDVTNISLSPNGRLRDMSNPHNSGVSGDNYWQPMHTSEMYIGTDDEGGVHTNSGIGNYAYYFFATAITKEKAEQVFYKALTDYLVSTSQFNDLRIAVIQATIDLYGANSIEVNKAKEAFDAVGIYENPGNDYEQNYPTNPGTLRLCYYDLDPSHTYSFYSSSIMGQNPEGLTKNPSKSKMSFTDDGTVGVYVSDSGTIRGINMGSKVDSEIQNQPIWSNVTISKDGNRLAAVTTVSDTAIWVYDYNSSKWAKFHLYNPTTSSDNQKSGGVIFSDGIEFDVTGEAIVYDAYNEIKSSTGVNLNYWDIGFINVWDNQLNKFGTGNILKLVSSLPEKISIGNPTFSKNSPYIIAFDFLDESTDKFSIVGMNLLTRDVDIIASNSTIGYPSYSKDDNALVYSSITGTIENVKGINLLSNKISPDGSAVKLINNAKWGVCYATGTRTLGLVPVTNFSSSIRKGKNPLTVQFFDNSINNPESWSWIFEGGTPSTSMLQNPAITYNTAGIYKVTLKTTNKFGNNTLVQSNYIEVIQSVLSVSANALTITAPANSTKTFDIVSNNGWTASNSQTWLTLSSSSGPGNATVTLTATANPTTSTRSAIITVSGTGVTAKTITVTQEGQTPVLNVSSSSLTIGALANSTKPFEVTSNIGWAASSNQNWLTVGTSSGSGNATITLTASVNLLTSTRTATVTVSGTGVTAKIITVTQEGAISVLNVSSNSLKIGASASSTQTFDITSNVNWSTSCNQSWLTINTSNGTGNSPITLTATANPSTSTRTATITVSGTGVITKTITVIQDGIPLALNVSSNSLTIAATANSTKTFDVTSNTPWTLAANQSWLSITVNNSNGTEKVTVTLSAEANPTTVTRSATITVSGTGVQSQIITVTQDGLSTGISDYDETEFVLFPNPTYDILYFNNSSNIGDVLVSVFDLNGKMVFKRQVIDNQINVSVLKKGVYTIKILGKSGTIIRKFAKK